MTQPTPSGRGRRNIIAGAIAVGALLYGITNTPFGQRIFAQIGVGEAWAATADAAEKIAKNGGNAVQAFLSRSPGERGAVDILKGRTKAEVAANATVPTGSKPTQRALGKIFDEPLQRLAGPLTPATEPVIEFLPLDANTAAAFLPDALPMPGGAGVFAPFVGGLPSSGGAIGGGGSGGTGDVATPPAPPVAIAAVPEPSTWILLLMGFAAVGASVRRRKAGKLAVQGRTRNCAITS